MKVGFSEVEYTPACGFMPGQFQAYFANGAYTALQANAAAFEQNGETVILISADHLLFHTASLLQLLCRLNSRACRLRRAM